MDDDVAVTDERVFRHDRLLGTLIEVRVVAESDDCAHAVDQVVVAEIERLDAVFSAFDASSELCRWRCGELVRPSPQLSEVLASALEWIDASDGGFNPMVGEVTMLWRHAEQIGVPPDPSVLAAAAAAIREPRFGMVDGVPVPTGDCAALNLHAIAKGFIVDRALDAGSALAPGSMCVNAGGDLAHRGSGSVRAGIENPHRPYDNEPPLCVIGVSNAAVATSGGARRGFRVGKRWFGHVIDPRTGWPVNRIASISVVATDAMTADVLATVAGVMGPADARAYLEVVDGVEGLVVDADRQQLATSGWRGLQVD